ncbi:MAG: flagellar biosynthetic protein FliR, partial [Gammaproteobacteria bacterium]
INVVETLANFIEWSGMAFLGAVLVALPIILTMMLINLCLGIVTRAAPALNILAVGFPAMVLSGMVLLVIYLVNINLRIEWLWIEAFTMAQDVWVTN